MILGEYRAMAENFNMPFYLMKSNEKFNPADYPADSNVEISGLEEAIRNTQESIANNKHDTLELSLHLAGLKRGLKKARENKKKKENR